MVELPSFEVMWDRLLEHLRDNATALGVPAQSIMPGVIGEPAMAPFIYVYAIPNADLQLANSHPMVSYADMPIVVGVEPALDTATATKAAMVLVEKVRRVLALLRGYMFSTTPPSYVGQHSNAFMLQTDCVGMYLPYVASVEEEPPPPDDDSPLLTDLAAYWPMEEASGTRYDAHGTNDLTMAHSTGADDGHVGSGAQFVATSLSSLSIADNAAMSIGDRAFTIHLWCKLDSLPADGDTYCLFGKWGSTAEYMLDLSRYGSICELRWIVSRADEMGNVSVVIDQAFATGEWYSILVYHDAENDVIGISLDNATPVISGIASGVRDDANALWIGAFNGASRYLNGVIDEVGVWHRLLTADERAEIYNSGAGITYPFT